jgi:MoxR-like ATPase
MSMLMQAGRVAAWLAGRDFVTPEDIRSVFAEVIGHRLYFQPVYELRHDEISLQLMRGILDHVAAP